MSSSVTQPPIEALALIDAAHAILKDSESWMNEKVDMQWLGPQRGVGISVSEPICAGQLLIHLSGSPGSLVASELQGYWESEAFTTFLSSVCQVEDHGSGGSAHLAVKLTNFLVQLGRGRHLDTKLGQYISCCSSAAKSVPFCWPDVVLQGLKGSALKLRLESAVQDLKSEAGELFAIWQDQTLDPPVTQQEFFLAYVRAHAIVATRAFTTTGSLGCVVVPVLDLLNHTSELAANVKVSFNDGIPCLHAVRDITAGEELCFCYDSNADCLDIWERYGFLDLEADIHTVEICTCSDVIQGTFWIPEKRVPLDCPLLETLQLHFQNCLGPDASDIQVHSASLKFLSSLIRAHLANYPEQISPSIDDENFTHKKMIEDVVNYEKTILNGTLEKVDAQVLAF